MNILFYSNPMSDTTGLLYCVLEAVASERCHTRILVHELCVAN